MQIFGVSLMIILDVMPTCCIHKMSTLMSMCYPQTQEIIVEYIFIPANTWKSNQWLNIAQLISPLW